MVLLLCKQAPENSDVRLHKRKELLTMVQSVNNQLVKVPMVVQVYKTRFEHYAVIHRDMKFTNTAVYMNLKKCQVRKKGKNEITLIADNIEVYFPIFVAFAGNGKSVYDAWRTPSMWNEIPAFYPHIGRRFHLRSRFIDNWGKLIYDLRNGWLDRRFLVNRSYAGCAQDYGWFVIAIHTSRVNGKRETCTKNIENIWNNPLTKSKWKSFIDNKVQSYWTNKILDDSKMYSTLQYMNCQYTIGKIHPLITTKTANNRDIVRIPSRTKIATGTYIFQSNRASFNKNKVNPTCKLCNKSPETLSHFLLTCESLEMVRKRLVDIIIDMGSELLAKSYFAEEVDLVQLIVNPFYYTVNKCNNEIVQNIAGQLERVCRQLINNLHMKRYDLLTKQQKCEKKNNLS
ncbi:unnamed protein product [Mytilus edulis]|uniref:Reverse transcriptase zinc-binding domain-containing protein n=1 Tax=Mytilus edulis TaxID=6550 RepID=A0A8S3UGJ1_MYTED|nr:unnamed protein product [Mytilus edulis]